MILETQSQAKTIRMIMCKTITHYVYTRSKFVGTYIQDILAYDVY